MRPIQIALLQAITISALSLQLAQPMVPAKPSSGANFALPNGPYGTVNTSLLSHSSNNVSRQWDGTIDLPLNGPNTSILFPLSTDPSQLWNNTSVITPNISTGSPRPVRPPDLPPFPNDWIFACSERLGQGMNPSSCLNAWTFIPPIERQVSFGPRSAANMYDVGLPTRYLSSDGRCFIEPSLINGNTEAHVKPSDAGIAAAYVIRECVGGRGQGGVTSNANSDNDLMVTVVQYNPEVVCSPEPFPPDATPDATVLKACEAILDKMETSKDLVIFAQYAIHTRLETPLPFYYLAPAEAPKCVLKVSGRLSRQFGNWSKIWQAAVAISAMCIRQGKGGYWDGLGATESLRVELGKAGRPFVEEE